MITFTVFVLPVVVTLCVVALCGTPSQTKVVLSRRFTDTPSRS